MCVCVCGHVCVHARVCACVCVCACAHACVHAHMCAHMRACVHMCVCVCPDIKVPKKCKAIPIQADSHTHRLPLPLADIHGSHLS